MARGNGQIRLRCLWCWTTKVRSPVMSRDCPCCGRRMRSRTINELRLEKGVQLRRFHWLRGLTARQVAL